MSLSLVHLPCEAQADFREVLVVIACVEQKSHFMTSDRLHSDDCFVVAFSAETTETVLAIFCAAIDLIRRRVSEIL